MGFLCPAGAQYSRFLPVVDINKCIQCHVCEKECLAGIAIVEHIKENKGLINNPECLFCGKCMKSCKSDAISIRFVWNRKQFKK